MACLECGLEQAVADTGICVRCGAPLTDPDYPSGALTSAGGAWIRRGRPYYMISLVFFLALYMICVFGFEQTQGSGLHHPMEWGIDLGVCGALLSLSLFEAARGQFRARQLAWGLVPLLSLNLLAFLPFLWVALMRRRTREWAVVAVYLAAEIALLFLPAGAPGHVTAGLEITAGLLAIAPVHAVLAFNPAAGPSSRREARAARKSQRGMIDE